MAVPTKAVVQTPSVPEEGELDFFLQLSPGQMLLVALIMFGMLAGLAFAIRKLWRFLNRREELPGSTSPTERGTLW
jgi:hypothetical protein